MKETVFVLALVLAAGISSDAAEAAVPRLRAGAAAVDITPQEFPVNMPGLFTRRPVQRVHDPLHSRALVLDDGTTTLALVVVDNLHVAEEACDEAKALASKQCGIATEKMLIASTHTHTAPSSNVKVGAAPEVAYRKLLVAGIVDSIVRAHAALRPAGMGTAATAVPEEVFCRRWYLKPGKMPPNPFGEMDKVKMNPNRSPEVIDRPAGPTDPDVTILSVEDAQSGKPLALLANYSLHYVGHVPKEMISADYFGEFAKRIQSRVEDADFVAMMSNGTSGDINNIPFLVDRPARKPFEQIEVVAEKTAGAAWEAREAIATHRQNVGLGMIERRITLKTRRPTKEQIARAEAVLATEDQAERDKLPRLAENYARKTLWMATYPETVSVPIQAVRIGDLAICALPFEAFAEIGLEIKKRSPFPRTMVIGLANAGYGYLPTPAQHELGGYETWLGTNRVQKDASVILTDALLEMLGDLRDGGA